VVTPQPPQKKFLFVKRIFLENIFREYVYFYNRVFNCDSKLNIVDVEKMI